MSEITSRYVAHDGAHTHYLDCRPDTPAPDTVDGAPILFVHGMTDVADDYRELADHVGRRTIVLELRGHGRSTATSGWDLAGHGRDIHAVADDAIDGPFHLMTFSRGTCYALGWLADHRERVLSLSIGDYPAREIGLTPATADHLLRSTWRGTPVTERLDVDAFGAVVAASVDRDLSRVVAGLTVPVLVVRSGDGNVPMTDDDWRRYDGLAPDLRRVRFDDSPHDIFRRDRGRYPRLVAELAARAEGRASAAGHR